MTAADLPAAAGSNSLNQDAKNTVLAPLKTARGVYVTVHGHFYQPPRENPYLNTVERQPSAAPFHDWNERIHHECYRPNAFARVLNEQGEVLGIVNNYEYLSFNIGAEMDWGFLSREMPAPLCSLDKRQRNSRSVQHKDSQHGRGPKRRR